MAQGLRELRGRMRSVSSMKKITRAFELIAASRVVRAQNRMNEALPYARAITAALSELAATSSTELEHTFLERRENIKAAGVIVVTSDRGLAGPYSSSVLRETESLLRKLSKQNVESKLFVSGRKGAAYFRFRGRQLVGHWGGFSEYPKFSHAQEMANCAIESFMSGEIDEIYVVFTHFVSSFTQRPVVRRFVPLEFEQVDDDGDIGHTDVAQNDVSDGQPEPMYEFEPDPGSVLDRLLPAYFQTRLYSALLEASASEQAARRRAMSTATDNASTLFDDYRRQFNRARQAQITQELMEVVGAAEAFSGAE